MKRVSNRSRALLLLCAMVLAGLSLYIFKFAANGKEWVSFPSNSTVYTNGVLTVGTVLDRNGVILAGVSDGKRVYADSAAVREATLHAVGDQSGNIGTGALKLFASRLMGYNFVSGAYSRSGVGKELYLTIDTRLNVAAYKALGGKKGAVGVMNYKTGELVCMVSAPSFDPSAVPDFENAGDKYEGAYINRFLSSVFTPGSTFKLVTLAAAIENIPDLYDRVFECEGSIKIGGDAVNCTKHHGELSIEEALAVSCNSTFAVLALELGADKLSLYADKLGLTRSVEIEAIKTAAGNFDKAEEDTADLAWSVIGQYNDTVCPAGMLRFVGAIANGGVAVDMRLIQEKGLAGLRPPSTGRLLSRATADKIATMMNYNVYKSYGESNFPGLEL
ncbi:MAG: penicillin-binding protein, partial [Clostridiales bacterium]|nr:penicillin-binding protein [Clostridiales bacterium]